MRRISPGALPHWMKLLTTEQIEQLKTWLIEDGLTYRQASRRAQETFGVRVRASSLTGFWHTVCAPVKPGLIPDVAKKDNLLPPAEQPPTGASVADVGMEEAGGGRASPSS